MISHKPFVSLYLPKCKDMSEVNEVFLPVKGYEGIYEVSDIGTIRSLDRTIVYNTGHNRPTKGTTTYQKLDKNGYYSVSLWLNNKEKRFSIHRLVALAFIPNPENKSTVNHKNGIKTDNHVDNLEWCTQSENSIHLHEVLGYVVPWKGRTGALSKASKKVNQLSLTGDFLSTFDSCTLAAQHLGIKRCSWISACCLGKAKTAYGYKWEYVN